MVMSYIPLTVAAYIYWEPSGAPLHICYTSLVNRNPLMKIEVMSSDTSQPNNFSNM